jgi:hypothetical protein
VNRGGDKLLTGARFAVNQDRRPTARHLRDVLHETRHGGVLADDAVELKTLVDARTELSGLTAQTRPLERAVDEGDHSIELEWFRQIALRAELDRLHRGVDRPESGHDDESGVWGHGTPTLDQ